MEQKTPKNNLSAWTKTGEGVFVEFAVKLAAKALQAVALEKLEYHKKHPGMNRAEPYYFCRPRKGMPKFSIMIAVNPRPRSPEVEEVLDRSGNSRK